MGEPAQYPSTSTATAADAMRTAITRPRFRGVLSLAAFRIMTTQRERENCKATRTKKSFIGVLWSAWRDGVVAHCVELSALEVEAAISSFTDLGPPQTRFTRSCVCPKAALRIPHDQKRSAPEGALS